MNEEEMDEQIAKIISEAIAQTSLSICEHSESLCNKDSPDYEPRRIHCGTDRCKGLNQND